MSKPVTLTVSVAWGLLMALIPVLTNTSIAAVGVGFCLAMLFVVGCWYCVRAFQKRLQRRRRGLVSVASGRSRTEDFSLPWTSAQEHVMSCGVGMTNIVRDLTLIEHTVARGCAVTFELVDPVWLRERPEVCELVDITYGRTRFVDQIERSFDGLIELRDRLNHQYGSGKVCVVAVQTFQPFSATIADPGTPGAWGFVEFHTAGFPLEQPRMRLASYESSSPLDAPLLDDLLLARRHLPRRRVDATTAMPDAPGNEA